MYGRNMFQILQKKGSNNDLAHDFHGVSIEGYDRNGFFFRNSLVATMQLQLLAIYGTGVEL